MARLFLINQFFDDAGDPLNGGKLYTYETGASSTPKTTYQDQAQGSAHANPIVLDSAGRPPGDAIWLLTDTEYRFVLKDSTAVTTYYTIDNICGIPQPLYEAFQTNNLKFANNKGIVDSSGNEQLIFTLVASAVNYINQTNSATGNKPTIEAKGDDTNIGLLLKGKGSGGVWGNLNRLDNAIALSHKSGLALTNDSDADHDVSIAVGSTADSSNTVLMSLTTAIVKRIDASWAVGTTNGGLPSTVSLSTSTWYHFFLIENTSGTVDAGWDTSVTASNLLTASGYTYYKRIGSHKTDSSSNIIPTTQVGNEIYWTTPVLDISGATITTSEAQHVLSVPPGVQTMVKIRASVSHASAGTLVSLRPPAVTDQAPSASIAPLASIGVVVNGAANYGEFTILTDTSKQIESRSSASGTTLNICTTGYRELF